MCCLRYEHEFYVQQRKRFPKEGKVVRTSRGEEKVIANDIFRERVTLRGGDGETRVMPLSELRGEMEASGVGALLAPIIEEPEPVDARLEIDEDTDIEQVIDSIVEEESGPMPTPAKGAPAAAPSNDASESARKPHRRRGRRGGRRNRAGRERDGGGGTTGPSSSGA
jgi:hypothetical protein